MSGPAVRWGYTLAEVLITIGIIGVIASLTIPNIVNNHLEKRRIVQLKKAYNTISRAFDMAIAENGTVDNWCARPVNWDECSVDITNKILPYMQKVKLCKGDAQWNSKYCFATSYKNLEGGIAGLWLNKEKLFRTSDGVSFNIRADCCDMFSQYWCIGTTNGYMNNCGSVNVDINGPDGPNVAGKDYFYFSIRKDKILPLGIQQDTHYLRSFSNRCLNFGDACAGWVIYNENMDYLHCKDLDWNGKNSCKQK